jgi:hypothetical protein
MMLPSTLKVSAYVDQRGRQPSGEIAPVNALP